MLESFFSMLVSMVQAMIAIMSTTIEFMAGFFVAAGETLGFFELMILLMIFCLEIIFWLVLWIVELIIALFTWRKPERIKRPVIWRPKPKVKSSKGDV